MKNKNLISKEIEEEVDIFNFLVDVELQYQCQYKLAYGCQKLHCGVCDKGERCMDI